MKEFVNTLDSKGIKTLSNFAKKPEQFVGTKLLGIIGRAGPQGALVAAIITAILASPILYREIIQVLGVKGGTLNQDFRFSQEEFYNLQFDRMIQFKRLTGDDPVITLDFSGFRPPTDPDFKGNSLIDIPESRTARISLQQSAYEYVLGI